MTDVFGKEYEKQKFEDNESNEMLKKVDFS